MHLGGGLSIAKPAPDDAVVWSVWLVGVGLGEIPHAAKYLYGEDKPEDMHCGSAEYFAEYLHTSMQYQIWRSCRQVA